MSLQSYRADVLYAWAAVIQNNNFFSIKRKIKISRALDNFAKNCFDT